MPDQNTEKPAGSDSPIPSLSRQDDVLERLCAGFGSRSRQTTCRLQSPSAMRPRNQGHGDSRRCRRMVRRVDLGGYIQQPFRLSRIAVKGMQRGRIRGILVSAAYSPDLPLPVPKRLQFALDPTRKDKEHAYACKDNRSRGKHRPGRRSRGASSTYRLNSVAIC